VVERVRAIAAAAEEADGVEALGEQPLLHLADGAEVLHLLAVTGRPEPPDGALAASATAVVGYAQLDDTSWAGDAELVVAPPRRRGGVGGALVAALRASSGPSGGRWAVWAHGNLPAAQALAASTGLTPVRELWRMARGLDPWSPGHEAPPGPDLGGGARLRPLDVEADLDVAAWLALNAAAFAQHPEQGRLTLEDLHARWREKWFDPRDLLLAELGGALVGSVWLKVEPGSDEGEIYVLAVAPSAQGRGLGRALTAAALDHLARNGLHRAVLFTESDNHAAVRTYTAAGFATDRVDAQYA